MSKAVRLTDLQVRVARRFFDLNESAGYVVVGGAALIAHGLIERNTKDLDIFGAYPRTTVDAARRAFVRSLRERGHDVQVVRAVETFCQIVVRDQDDEVRVDLAIDALSDSTPTVTVLGPTLAPLETAGRKMLALFGRAEARDFADVHALAQRFGKDALLRQAAAGDAGFVASVFAQMLDTLARFADADIPIDPDETPRPRAFFAEWAAELR